MAIIKNLKAINKVLLEKELNMKEFKEMVINEMKGQSFSKNINADSYLGLKQHEPYTGKVD